MINGRLLNEKMVLRADKKKIESVTRFSLST